MSSQPRTAEQPVSLPSIHELFPEHLMNSPPLPSSSRTHRHLSTAQYRSGHPREVSRGPSESYHYSSPHPNALHAHYSRATLASRPLGVPHASGPPAAGPSGFPSQRMVVPHHRDNNQHEHPVVSIPPSHSARLPKSQGLNDYPGAQSITYPGTSRPSPPLDDPESPTDDDTPSAGTPSGIPRKHICPICHKAFNRPSSLKIHYNTHTGATPFRCPWPKCGREFNVNSNMRRHYRNHTANSNQEVQDDGARRRRRRSSASSPNDPLPMMQQSVGDQTRTQPHSGARHEAPTSHYDAAPHGSGAVHQYRTSDYSKDYPGMEVDDVDEYHVSEDPHRSSRLPVPVMRASQTLTEPRGTEHSAVRHHLAPRSQQEHPLRHHHSHSSSSSSMRMRALTPGSSFHSSSPSPSSSPSLSSSTSPFNSPPPSTLTSPANSPAMLPRAGQNYQYSPSMPYLRSARDPHVSTALRPAFSGGSDR